LGNWGYRGGGILRLCSKRGKNKTNSEEKERRREKGNNFKLSVGIVYKWGLSKQVGGNLGYSD